MSRLDDLYPGLQSGDDEAGMAFYRVLGDTELFLLLTAEAEGDAVVPRVFDLDEGRVVLAFDDEARLAGFSDQVLPYAALPGRVVAAQMAGQGLSLGLNLGTGAASETILPPEALDWLTTMLDFAPPQALEARIDRFEPPQVPGVVLAALRDALTGAGRAYLAGARYHGGARGQVLVLTGVAPASEARMARALAEALAFSGADASALDVVFVAEGDRVLARLSGIALVLEGVAVTDEAPPAPKRVPWLK